MLLLLKLRVLSRSIFVVGQFVSPRVLSWFKYSQNHFQPLEGREGAEESRGMNDLKVEQSVILFSKMASFC